MAVPLAIIVVPTLIAYIAGYLLYDRAVIERRIVRASPR